MVKEAMAKVKEARAAAAATATNRVVLVKVKAMVGTAIMATIRVKTLVLHTELVNKHVLTL